MNKFFLLLFIVLSSFFLLRYFVVGQAVYGDGLYYWGYTHSLYTDQDLDLSNELSHHYSPESNNSILPEPPPLKKDAYIEYRYPPLASLSFLPAFAFADLIVILFHLPHNGYSDLYQITVGLFNSALVVCSLAILFSTLRLYFSKKVAVLTLLLLLFATNLVYYGSLDVINSHPLSFFLSCLYLTTALGGAGRLGKWKWLPLGLLSGLLGATRTQDALLLGLTYALLLYDLGIHHSSLIKTARKGLLVLLGFSIGFLPQIAFWKIVYGKYVYSPYDPNGSGFDFMHPHLVDMLTYYKTGIFLYTPLLVFVVLGMFLFIKRAKAIGSIFFVFFFLQYYLISSWNAWHQGESFGPRMLLSTYPILSLGLASFVSIAFRTLSNKLVYIFSVFLIMYTFTMIIYFQLVIQAPTYISGEKTRADSIILNHIQGITGLFSFPRNDNE